MNKHKVRKPKEDLIWTLHFNGSKCKLRVGTSIELINPKGKPFYIAYQLQFRCTNNIVEYEELIQGILFTLDKGITSLIIEGDSQLVIRQMKSVYSYNDKRFLTSKKRVGDLMDDFEALNIKSIPRRKNMVLDALVISASALQLVKRTKLK